MTFAEWLKAARKKAGLTQEKLAELADTGRTYIITLEKGHIKLPQFETRQRLHAALGTSEEDLVRVGLITRKGQIVAIQETQAIYNIESHRDPIRADAVAIVNSLEPRKLGAALQVLQAIEEARDVGRLMLVVFPAP